MSRIFTLNRWYAVSLALFALGLMAKPMLVTLPFVLLLLDWWPLGRVNSGGRPGRIDWRAVGRLVLEKLPFLFLAAGSSALTFLAQRAGQAMHPYPPSERIINALASYPRYLGKTLWPLDLAPYYPHPGSSLTLLQGGAALAAILAISLLALAAWRRCPALITGWLWFLGMLVPVVGVVQVGTQALADRYTYLPMLGPALGLGCVLEWAVRGSARRRALTPVLFAVIFVILGALTFRQAGYWRDDGTLWGRALSLDERNGFAHYNLGAWKQSVGRTDEAAVHYRSSLLYRSNVPESHNNLALILYGEGRVEEAMEHYARSIAANPAYPPPYNNIGLVLSAANRLEEASMQFRQALRISPGYLDARLNLGIVLARMGRLAEAESEFREALRRFPAEARAHAGLGAALAGRGRKPEAVLHLQEALRLNPADELSRANLEKTLAAPLP